MTEVLERFDRIMLDDMKSVRLMNRIDTKYLATEKQLHSLLSLMADDYYLQEIEGEVLMPYYTRYYDTSDLEMYREHQRGRLSRRKIRIRRYEGSGLEFLEVKRKNNKGRTRKERMKHTDATSDDVRSEFIRQNSEYEAGMLTPKIENRFRRLTLVNRAFTERLTIDTSLSFKNFTTGNNKDLSGLVVIELKRDGRSESPVIPLLRKLRIKASGFSKYCMGLAMTDATLPAHRFKERLRMIDRMLTNSERLAR